MGGYGQREFLRVAITEEAAENHDTFGMDRLTEGNFTLDIHHAFGARVNRCGNARRRTKTGIAQGHYG